MGENGSAATQKPFVYRSVQAGRGLASLLVVLFHATVLVGSAKYWHSSPLGGAFLFGHAGVYFFFVLSGFIIYSAHAGDIGCPDRLPGYLRNRAARIYPPLWIALALVIPMLIAAGQRPPLLLAAKSFLLIGSRAESVLAVGWTLFFELCFYALFASFLLHRTVGWAIMAAWAGVCLTGAWPNSYITSPLNLLFLAGLGCAWLLRRRAISFPALALAGGAALFAGTGAVQLLTLGRQLEPGEIAHVGGFIAGYGVASCLLLLGGAQLERVGQLPIPIVLQRLGDASYSIYLVHYPLLSLSAKLLRRCPAPVVFPLLVSIGVAGGLVFHLAVERPLVRRLSGHRVKG